jgi:hypothetical protein
MNRPRAGRRSACGSSAQSRRPPAAFPAATLAGRAPATPGPGHRGTLLSRRRVRSRDPPAPPGSRRRAQSPARSPGRGNSSSQSCYPRRPSSDRPGLSRAFPRQPPADHQCTGQLVRTSTSTIGEPHRIVVNELVVGGTFVDDLQVAQRKNKLFATAPHVDDDAIQVIHQADARHL